MLRNIVVNIEFRFPEIPKKKKIVVEGLLAELTCLDGELFRLGIKPEDISVKPLNHIRQLIADGGEWPEPKASPII